ncbi:hypothetical protein [Microbispora triticiradicis]|uniref:hypothetical protein n=1 Tax=Microbispora triticiradicis TaxID=2200763 RepID=UPI001404BCB7|nr:hypothetical protein [Microbispora triticiradicis]
MREVTGRRALRGGGVAAVTGAGTRAITLSRGDATGALVPVRGVPLWGPCGIP